MTSLETALYTVLLAAIEGAQEEDVLFGVEVLATVYDVPSKPRAIRIGDTNFDLSPVSGGAVEEFDVLGRVEILSPPEGDAPEDFVAAREDRRNMTLAVAQVLFDNPTLGGGVHDSRILGGVGGWGNLKGQRTAVANVHVIANETGAYRRE
jgi:hypothetical protein